MVDKNEPDLHHSILPVLQQIRSTLQKIEDDYQKIAGTVDIINERVNVLFGLKEVCDTENKAISASTGTIAKGTYEKEGQRTSKEVPASLETTLNNTGPDAPATNDHRSTTISRIILTTYPGQAGIDPLMIKWGHKDPMQRGPVVVSRNKSTIRRRNGRFGLFRKSSANLDILFIAIGAHGGSYAIYHALAVANKNLDIGHRPDFTNTEPAANIGPFPQWADSRKIVSMDPLGHLAPWLFRDVIQKENIDIRPTIAITKAHMKLPELDESVRSGRLIPDGKICLNETGELAVTKFAVEPVWYLPGVAERFGVGRYQSILCEP